MKKKIKFNVNIDKGWFRLSWGFLALAVLLFCGRFMPFSWLAVLALVVLAMDLLCIKYEGK